jgi:hypothetical protein
MKKIILICFLLFTVAISSQAQSIEINPFAGYNFGDKFYIYGGNARIGDGFTYGGTLTLVAGEYNAIELTYMRTDMTVNAYSNYLGFDISDPSSSNYIVIGGSRLFPVTDKLIPYAGANIGLGIFASRNDTYSSVEKLAVGLDAGLKLFLTDKVGLRLQSNLYFPVTNVGAGLWWSSGGGTSVGASGSVPFVQFGFTGGLIFKIK